MNPWLQALIMRAHAQRNTPGQDEVFRAPGLPSGSLMGLFDPGIYGSGSARLEGYPVQPPSPAMFQAWREPAAARNVFQGLQQGLDVNLTGSGLELTPAQIAGERSVLDMLQQYLRSPANTLQRLPNMAW